MRRLLFLGLLVLPAIPLARAAEQKILGAQFQIKNPSTPEKRKITVKAKETASPNTLIGNPVLNGATVTIDADGTTPSSQTYSLPTGVSSKGKPFWTGDAVKGFKYNDSKGQNGPAKSAQVTLNKGVFQIKITIDGKLGAVDVVPPNVGSAGCAFLTLVGGDSYSVQFASGQITNKGSTLFKVKKPTSEGSCAPTTTTSTSTTTSTTIGFPSIPPPGPAPLRYRDAVFTGVTTTTNVTYGTATNVSNQLVTLQLDIYEPTGDTITARPLIIWVHGGSFAVGDKTSPELVDEANTFAKEGYVNASINYRLEPPGCPGANCASAIVEAEQDAQTAVSFFRTNAATYGIDPTRIAMGGSSAGAITAMNVAFASSENPASAVAAAMSLSGGNLLGPITAGDPPTLLFHGTADPIVPYALSLNTFNAAIAAGLDSFLTTFPGAGHVPYVANRTTILDQTSNFLWWEMDLANAAQ